MKVAFSIRSTLTQKTMRRTDASVQAELMRQLGWLLTVVLGAGGRILRTRPGGHRLPPNPLLVQRARRGCPDVGGAEG